MTLWTFPIASQLAGLRFLVSHDLVAASGSCALVEISDLLFPSQYPLDAMGSRG